MKARLMAGLFISLCKRTFEPRIAKLKKKVGSCYQLPTCFYR